MSHVKCKVCGEDGNPEKEGRAILYCSKCLTPHHIDCWQYNKKCSVYACDGIEFQSQGVTPITVSEKIKTAEISFFDSLGTACSIAFAGICGFFGVKLILTILGMMLAFFSGCDAGEGSDSRLIYSPALNTVVCYRSEYWCIRGNRPCVKVNWIFDHETDEHKKVYEPKQTEFIYLHPSCDIDGRFIPTNPCVHLKWLLENPQPFKGKLISDKFCTGRFYDCFRENKPCITKIMGKNGGFIKIIENKLHPQCTVCGHWLVEGLCTDHTPNVTTSSIQSLNAFQLFQVKNE